MHSIARLKDWVGRISTYLQATFDEVELVISIEIQFLSQSIKY